VRRPKAPGATGATLSDPEETSAGAPAERPALRSFGRIRGRPIKPRQAGLMESQLPRLAIPAGPIDPAALAPAAAETWLEIGFGGGEHLAAQAARRPDVLLLGAEPFLNGVASALRHIDEAGLGNVRLHAGDARDLVAALPDGAIARVFILFPDPWPKARHHKRRLIQPAFVADLARVTAAAGRLRFVTDWADYADQTLRVFAGEPRFAWLARRADDWRLPPADHVATRYEAKRLGDCAPVWLEFARRADDQNAK
jgi:tRNA (guanine-N7-)-methyltransferase